jgi:hypothetical protein
MLSTIYAKTRARTRNYSASRKCHHTHTSALLRSRGRPSPLHRTRLKGSALPADPTERGGPPPLLGLSPGLCGPTRSVVYFTNRTVSSIGPGCVLRKPAARVGLERIARRGVGKAREAEIAAFRPSRAKLTLSSAEGIFSMYLNSRGGAHDRIAQEGH